MSTRLDAAAMVPRQGAVPGAGAERRRRAWRRPGAYSLATGFIIVLVTLLIVVPIGRMLVRTFVVDGTLSLAQPFAVFEAPWFLTVFGHTALLVTAATVLSVVMGSLLAWLNERTEANLGVIGSILPLTPLLIPNIALAIGWVFLSAPRVGLINGILAALPGVARGEAPQVDIYSWGGLIWVYVIHGVPYVYLIVSAALQNFDPAIEEASRTSGAGPWRTLRRVSLPAIKPAVLAATLMVAVQNLGLYSIPTVIAPTAGIDVLAVRIVRLINNTYPSMLAEAQVLSLLKLVVVAMLWAAYSRISRRGNYMTTGGRAAGHSRLRLGRWRGPARALMIGYMACASVIPLAALLIVSLQPYWTPRIDFGQFTLDNFRQVLLTDGVTITAFRNSLVLSVAGATIAMAVATLAAIYVLRRPGGMAQTVDAVLKAPAVIPSVVIAVGFLVTFIGPPFSISGTPLLLMAYVIIYLPSGSIATSAAVMQIGRDLQEASAVAGAGEARTARRVILPLAAAGLVGGWTVVFVHIMGDLSASSLLAGVGSPVIGFTILQIWENGSFSTLAAFSACMCVVIGLVVGLSTWFVRSRLRAGGA